MTNLKYYFLLTILCFVDLSSSAQTGRKDDNFHKSLMECDLEGVKKEPEAGVDPTKHCCQTWRFRNV